MSIERAAHTLLITYFVEQTANVPVVELSKLYTMVSLSKPATPQVGIGVGMLDVVVVVVAIPDTGICKSI
jgi:hypothetical protein